MGQSEIIEVLSNAKRPLNRGQIAKRTGIDPVSVSHTLKSLLKCNEINCIEVDRNKAAELLNSKSPLRRMRFYYLSNTQRRYLI